MPTIRCLCGESIDLSAIPSPHGFVLISESDWEDITNHVGDALAGRRDSDDLHRQVLGSGNSAIKQLYKCPHCGRLYLFDPPNAQSAAAVWVLESGDPTALERSA
jgi:hypothetical protein